MRNITLGSTGITVPQNAFGALPIQRDSVETAVSLVRQAYAGGMLFFDTARAYSDSEKKLGIAFEGVERGSYYLASKTDAVTPDEFRAHLETSLRLLKTDYLDIYQFHCANRCYRPGDGTGMYECMLEAKRQGKIRHIGITAHKLGVAVEAVESGLYETLQFPFSYLSGAQEQELVALCRKNNVGFIAMKALAGGLITNPDAAMGFIARYDNVLPIWGIQRQSELEAWLSFMTREPVVDEAFLKRERVELAGDFCRGCGYCMPCPAGIQINQCARISQMVRRAPSNVWLNEYWQAEMQKVNGCISCGRCAVKCPYELKPYLLLRKNYEDYQRILRGETVI